MNVLGFVCVCVTFYGVLSTELSVPKDVMSFILGCDGRFSSGGPKIPVPRTDTDPDAGAGTKGFTMMDISQLRRSLMDTVESDDVVGRILSQVEESLEARHYSNDVKSECTNIKIDVPVQEVKGLSEQLQAVIQQNNYQLLEQVNTLFAFKLNSFHKEMESLIALKMGDLAAGLIQIQQNQQEMAAAPCPTSSQGSETPDASVGETRIFQPSFPPKVSQATEEEDAPEEVYATGETEPKSRSEYPIRETDPVPEQIPDSEMESQSSSDSLQPLEEEPAIEEKDPKENISEATPEEEDHEEKEKEKNEQPTVSSRRPLSRRPRPRIGGRIRSNRPIVQAPEEDTVEEEPAVSEAPREESLVEKSRRTRMEAVQERRRQMLERLRGR